MSEQIQYNYYSTVTTKIGENSFIFRGKLNMPNLVLQNGDSYISTKLTIHSEDGTVKIEHEPITNYSKRVIATFPIPLYIDIKIGESKEINLNSIIPKSLRFDIDESGDAIFLHPVTSSMGSVEGFCNNDMCKKLQKGIDAANARIAKQETRPGGGNMSDADYAALAARLAAMNGSGGLGGADDGGELVCTPITDSEDNEMTLVGVTNTLSELEMTKAAENSVYHQSAINVVAFIGGFLLISKVIGALYSYLANTLRSPSILTGIELLIASFTITIILVIYLAFIKGPPKVSETPTQKKQRESDNLTLMYVAVTMSILLVLFTYLIYDYRKTTYAVDKKDIIAVENFKRIFGDRDCYNTLTYVSKGFGGISEFVKEYITAPSK